MTKLAENVDSLAESIILPKIVEPETPYLANMRALCEHLPRFAQEIDQVAQADWIPCEPARRGGLTCQLEGEAGRPVYVHSRYDPEREAQRWAEGVEALAQGQYDEERGTAPMCYFVDGLGLGYHVRALFERLEGEAFIAVSEPNLGMIRTAFNRFDFSEMLESERFILITGTERAEIFKKVEQHATVMMMGVVFTHPLQRIETAFHGKVHTLLTEFVSYVRANLWTLLGCSMQTCKNVLHNLPMYVSTPSVEVHKGRFAGCPAVLVAAGPSLRKNIETLKRIRDRVVVIAVQTVLKLLLAAGIEPDFVTSLDFAQVCKRFFEGVGPHPNVHLVAEPKAHWEVIDTYRGIGPMTLLGNDFAELNLRDEEDTHGRLAPGTTVAHLSFYVAEYLGADPIILIGQDLGFTDHVYYAPGNALHDVWGPELNRFCTMEMKEWERIKRQGESLRQVKDQGGRAIYTDDEMFTYLQQFERDFSKSKAQVIDASEGGVKKQYTQAMSLESAAETYCREPIGQERFSYQEAVAWQETERQGAALKQLRKRIEEVEWFAKVCEETTELVREMLELLDDQPALNRRMIRLDELRSLVRQQVKTYKMVGYVSQTAELYRFWRDRTIGVENKRGKERQRQQLLRDIGYVSELKKGCGRILDLLQEGVERFEDEMDLGDSKT